ncbi:MAG: XdhC family protein, partial [Acidimicrobiia bacterium]
MAAAAAARARGEAFVLATVVWSRGPSSGKQSSKALIYPDGRVEGWLGGACAEPTLVLEAREALTDGRSRLLALGLEGDLPPGLRDDVTTVSMACESEGAMAVFLEPVLPAPRLLAVGRSPAVDTLVRLAAELGWQASVVDDEGSPDAHPGVESVFGDLSKLSEADRGTFVVVATQGHYDEAALERALSSEAGYVGLVASRKRADSVLELLRGRGVSEEQLARVRAPAGLDLGKVAHEEMAVAILAELVALRATGEVTTAVPAREQPETALDPVCGMTVEVATARRSSVYGGQTYYFCSAG